MPDSVNLVGGRLVGLQEVVDPDDHGVDSLLELQRLLLQAELGHEPRDDVLVLDFGSLVEDGAGRERWRADNLLQFGHDLASLSNDSSTAGGTAAPGN